MVMITPRRVLQLFHCRFLFNFHPLSSSTRRRHVWPRSHSTTHDTLASPGQRGILTSRRLPLQPRVDFSIGTLLYMAMADTSVSLARFDFSVHSNATGCPSHGCWGIGDFYFEMRAICLSVFFFSLLFTYDSSEHHTQGGSIGTNPK